MDRARQISRRTNKAYPMRDSGIPDAIRKLSEMRAARLKKILQTQRPPAVKPGQIWSTFSRIQLPDNRQFELQDARLLVILKTGDDAANEWEQVMAAPISLETVMA